MPSERRKPDWWALTPAVTKREDIVTQLQDSTGYFHDSEAEKLRDIAESSGTKPVGLVRAAVEQKIEALEWKCIHFEHDPEKRYPQSSAIEYYKGHRQQELAYQLLLDSLTDTSSVYDSVPDDFELVHNHIQKQMRIHQAKSDQAKQFLQNHDCETPDVTVENPFD